MEVDGRITLFVAILALFISGYVYKEMLDIKACSPTSFDNKSMEDTGDNNIFSKLKNVFKESDETNEEEIQPEENVD